MCQMAIFMFYFILFIYLFIYLFSLLKVNYMLFTMVKAIFKSED